MQISEANTQNESFTIVHSIKYIKKLKNDLPPMIYEIIINWCWVKELEKNIVVENDKTRFKKNYSGKNKSDTFG